MNPPTLALPVQAELWARLLALDLDGAASLSFSKRLARDNGWPPGFAQRVVLEYKKFVYLAATCGHPVTPSDEVDQAWHLHLVYTRSYWDELCGQVLGFALHHGPTKGGAAEGQKFNDWYARTLASYQAAFGEAPPADIWPPAAVRFGEAPHFRRVNLRRHWLLPRPRLRLRLGRRTGLAVAALLVLVGCTARTPLNPFDWYGPEFLTLYWGLCGTLYPLALWLRHRGRGPEAPYTGTLPNLYELARLAGRGKLIADSALAALIHGGHLELLPGQKVRRVAASWPAHPYEQTVWAMAPENGTVDIATVRERASTTQLERLRSIDQALEQKGLLLPAAERQRLDLLPTLAAWALGLFGLAKVVAGSSRGRPVGFLLLSLGLLAVVHFVCARQLGAWATGQGKWLLNSFKTAVRQQRVTEGLSGRVVALSVALFGVAELKWLGLEPLAEALLPTTPAAGGSDGGGDGGSGCGSGDGGSGCGGSGCGGCGGCGGGD